MTSKASPRISLAALGVIACATAQAGPVTVTQSFALNSLMQGSSSQLSFDLSSFLSGQGLSVDRGRGRDRRCRLDSLGAGGDGAGQQGEGEQGGAQTHHLASARPRPAPFQPYQATTAKQAAGSRKAMLAP